MVAARDWLAGAKALAPASALKIKATFMVDFQFADGCESSRKQYKSKPNNEGEMDRELMFRWLLPSSFSYLLDLIAARLDRDVEKLNRIRNVAECFKLFAISK